MKTPEELQAEEEAKKLEAELEGGVKDPYEEIYTPPHQQLGYETEEDMVATLESDNKTLREQIKLRDERDAQSGKKGFEIPVTAEEFEADPIAATKKIVEAARNQETPSTVEADLKIELDQAVNREVRAAGLKGYDEDVVFGKMLGLSNDPKNASLNKSKEGIAKLGEMALKEVDKMLKRKTPSPPEHQRPSGSPSGDPDRRAGLDNDEGEVDYDKAFAEASARGDLNEINRLAFDKHHKEVASKLSGAKKG